MTELAKPAGSATLTYGEKSVELPVLAGSTGPDVIDIRKLYGATDAFTYDPGFTSTASCESALTFIDGDKGVLLHRGYPIDQLAAKSNFIEVCHLLLHGELPTASEYEAFERSITMHTMLHSQFDRFFEGFRRDRRHLGDQPDGRDIALDRILNVQAVVIEGRQRADRAHHDRHRVRIAAEAFEEAVELRMQHGVHGDAAFEGLVLRSCRQLDVQQQVADLDEVGFRRQLVDRIATMQQHALVAVDESQGAFARGRRGSAGIVGEGFGRAVELADVDDIRAGRT